MTHADLFNDLDKNGTAILRTRMAGWEDFWYVIPRPNGVRYVGVANRHPPLAKPNRLHLNRRPTPLLRSIDEAMWFVRGTIDRTKIIYVHPDYAVELGKALVSFVNHD